MRVSAFAGWIDATSLWWIAFGLLLVMIAASRAGNVRPPEAFNTLTGAGNRLPMPAPDNTR